MQKGNNCNTLQEAEEALSGGTRKKDFSDNRRLLEIAQGDTDEAEAATTELVILNTGLVRSIALRFRERGVDFEDLMQIGTLGLLKAIRSFDLERGTCFSTYAVPLIFGELRRYMRDEGPIKVGRYYKRLGAALMNTRNRIVAEEGRDPTVGELAKLCNVSVEEAAMAMEAMSPIVSLSDSAYGDDDSVELSSVIPDEESSSEIERLSDKIAINQAMSKMPEQWRKIIMLRYYRNMTQQQTAELLGITQVKVSREEKKIIESLRTYFL
ncbi:MAG: sigma-70 family RNA polymerase sigma factor [Clostridia bacterium]|nr:sigma-70 family RNA polymerase sigma factor [Clostridia bacterium]